MTIAIQNGTCQLCGRMHAVLPNGRIAKHGYRVLWNQFTGSCYGADELPYELSHDAITRLLARQYRDVVPVPHPLSREEREDLTKDGVRAFDKARREAVAHNETRIYLQAREGAWVLRPLRDRPAPSERDAKREGVALARAESRRRNDIKAAHSRYREEYRYRHVLTNSGGAPFRSPTSAEEIAEEQEKWGGMEHLVHLGTDQCPKPPRSFVIA